MHAYICTSVLFIKLCMYYIVTLYRNDWLLWLNNNNQFNSSFELSLSVLGRFFFVEFL